MARAAELAAANFSSAHLASWASVQITLIFNRGFGGYLPCTELSPRNKDKGMKPLSQDILGILRVQETHPNHLTAQ